MSRFAALCSACTLLAGLAFAQDKADVPALVKQLKDPDAFVRLKAAKTLGQLGGNAKEAVPALKALLADDDEDVRTVAKRALDAIGDPGILDPKVAELVGKLRDKNTKTRLDALAALAKSGPAARSADVAVIDSMLAQYPKTREEHLDALEKVHPELHKHVVALLLDREKGDALEGLKAMKENAKAAAPLVLAYCEQDARNRYPEVRQHAKAIRTLAQVAPTDPRVQKRTVVLLTFQGGTSNHEAFLREAVLNDIALYQLPAAQAVPALATALSDAENVETVIAALTAYGTAAKAAVPALTKLKLAENRKVREAAAAALQKINP